MSNTYYPIMLQLQGKHCFVIGGGKIATRKVSGLLKGGADRITVISPVVTERIKELWNEGKLEWIQEHYDEAQIKEALIIFAATDNVELNDRISDTMNQRGLFVCNVSRGSGGNFITPAAIYRDDMTIAVSTGGASPKLTQRVKADIEQYITTNYTDAFSQLAAIRAYIIARHTSHQLKSAMLALALEDCLEQRVMRDNEWYDSLLERCTRQQSE